MTQRSEHSEYPESSADRLKNPFGEPNHAKFLRNNLLLDGAEIVICQLLELANEEREPGISYIIDYNKYLTDRKLTHNHKVLDRPAAIHRNCSDVISNL